MDKLKPLQLVDEDNSRTLIVEKPKSSFLSEIPQEYIRLIEMAPKEGVWSPTGRILAVPPDWPVFGKWHGVERAIQDGYAGITTEIYESIYNVLREVPDVLVKKDK